MHWAAFADEPGAKPFHNFGTRNENAPESIRVLRIVGAVSEIAVERHGGRDLLGLEIDFDRDAERSQSLEYASIEAADRLRSQRTADPGAFACRNPELMFAEVELDIEDTEFSPGVGRMLAMVGLEGPFDHGRQQMKLLADLEVTNAGLEEAFLALTKNHNADTHKVEGKKGN